MREEGGNENSQSLSNAWSQSLREIKLGRVVWYEMHVISVRES